MIICGINGLKAVRLCTIEVFISDVYTSDENKPLVKVRDIQSVYNFIGAFDFEEAREQSQAAQKIKKIGVA